MIEIGRICVKICGRDAGKKCVIVDFLDNNYVLIDGETRRRKCNVSHLEPTKTIIELDKGSDHAFVVSKFSELGIELDDKKSRSPALRPMKKRKGTELKK